MRGLRTQESKEFERFFELIQEEAKKEKAIFFAFAGDGNVTKLQDIECEDMSGWLIPNEKADQFEREWMENNSMSALEEWEEFFTETVYEIKDGKVSVSFAAWE